MATILIVEDDNHIRAMLQETFTEEGYDTLLAANGVEGFQIYRQRHPDIVITDILMPQKEGLSLITDLRKSDPKARIIAISGGAPQLQAGCNLELAKVFGADCTFQKPLQFDALLSTVAHLLQNASGGRGE